MPDLNSDVAEAYSRAKFTRRMVWLRDQLWKTDQNNPSDLAALGDTLLSVVLYADEDNGVVSDDSDNQRFVDRLEQTYGLEAIGEALLKFLGKWKETMKVKDLKHMVQEAVQKAIRENLDRPVDASDLDDATQLLMLITGRIMSAHGKDIPSEVIQKAVHHIEQADGILAAAGLKADEADVRGIAESISKQKR